MMRRTVWLSVVLLVVVALCCPVLGMAAQGGSRAEGCVFGAANAQEIASNIDVLFKAADAANVSRAALYQHAQESAALYRTLVPEKLEWIQGVADGSGIALQDLYVLNFSDKLVGGLYGECTTFMAQGSAVEGGGTVIAKNRDQSITTLSEVTVQEAARHPEGALYQAAYIAIPEVLETYRFVGSRTAGRWGYGMGVNEHGVLAADNDANSRDELQFDAGLHDNDVIRLILERAKTAREGVDVVTALVEAYGQAWNGIIFEIGDENELWLIEVTGKRWAAKCYQDTVTARSNQFQLEADYDLCCDDLISFAQDTWGAAPEADGKLNFRGAYATVELYPETNEDIAARPAVETLYNTQMRYARAMELLEGQTAQGGTVTLPEFAQMTRDHFDSYTLPSGAVVEMNQIPFYSSDLCDWYGREWMTDYPARDTIETSIYIRGACSHDLGWGATSTTGILVAQKDQPTLMLHSYMPPCMGTFVPFYAMQESVDGRYATPDAASLFNTIATKSFGFYPLYHEGVRAAFDPYEAAMFDALSETGAEYARMSASGDSAGAHQLLTSASAQAADDAYTAAQTALTYMQIAAVENSSW